MKVEKTAVIGAGYVGLTHVTLLASLDYSVTCVDVDAARIACLREGQLPISEPGLEEAFREHLRRGKIKLTTSVQESVDGSQMVFICVGTPPKPDGSPDLSQLEAVARDLAHFLPDYVTIVLKSTVPVGTCAGMARLLAELNPEARFAVVANPEFLREGSALRDALHPDRIIIGGMDQKAIQQVHRVYEKLDAPVVITGWETAEMIKYASNAYLATKISFINELACLCERVGVDVSVVAKGIGLDPRIGPAFLQAGIGYGGSCLPKDLSALIHLGRISGCSIPLLRAVEKVNSERPLLAVGRITGILGDLTGKKIGVWGLSFKSGTEDLRSSPALAVVSILLEKGALVCAYDPMTGPEAVEGRPALQIAQDYYEAAVDAEVLAILTDWGEFGEADWPRVASIMRSPIIFDGRNLLNPAEMRRRGFEYYALGRPSTVDVPSRYGL